MKKIGMKIIIGSLKSCINAIRWSLDEGNLYQQNRSFEMTVPVFNVEKKERYVYRIKFEETKEYCKNFNNEPCECGTIGWAEVLLSNCKLQHPGKALVIVKEKYYVKR